MAFCGKCGAQVQDGVGFCPRCGQPMAAAPAPPQHYAPPPPAQYQQPGMPPAQYQAPGVAAAGGTGLEENIASVLCYVLGWLTGIVFLLIDKRPIVRFNAAQSLVTFGGIGILVIIIGMITGGGMFFGGFGGYGWGFGPGFGMRVMLFYLGVLLNGLLELVGFILWIVCMLKAYQGVKFRVPVAAGIAESIAGKAA